MSCIDKIWGMGYICRWCNVSSYAFLPLLLSRLLKLLLERLTVHWRSQNMKDSIDTVLTEVMQSRITMVTEFNSCIVGSFLFLDVR
mmetsp:Transcript_13208/g.13375  ORF Transcript_13208/g.13375 Transcript_13208/m.13375 type:complete len:86 (-) Transcript_13208:518-775(-)